MDIENSSERLDGALLRLREELYRMVRSALGAADVSDDAVVLEDRGDGVLALVAPAAPKIALVDPALPALVAALRQHNETVPLDQWLRLRVALHAGEVRRDADGWASRDLTHVFRLCEAPVVKQSLRLASRAQCVVVCSEHFYRSVVEHGDRDVDPATYRAVDVIGLDRPTRAWLHVPGYALPPLPAHDPDDEPTARARARNRASDDTSWEPGTSYTSQRDVNVFHHNGSNVFHNGGVVNNGGVVSSDVPSRAAREGDRGRVTP